MAALAPDVEEEYKGQYLEGMPHNQSNPSLLPLYPAWSMLCLGPSSLYTHAHGKGSYVCV